MGNVDSVVISEGSEVILPDYMMFAEKSVNWHGTKSAVEAIVAFGRDPNDGGYLIIRGDGLIMTASCEKFGNGWPTGVHDIKFADSGLTIVISFENIELEASACFIIDRAMSTGVTIDLNILDRYLGRA